MYIVGGASTITGNSAYQNTYDGIYAGTGSTVIGNACRANDGWGIYLSGNSYVGQNTAHGNTDGNINACPTCSKGLNHAP